MSSTPVSPDPSAAASLSRVGHQTIFEFEGKQISVTKDGFMRLPNGDLFRVHYFPKGFAEAEQTKITTEEMRTIVELCKRILTDVGATFKTLDKAEISEAGVTIEGKKHNITPEMKVHLEALSNPSLGLDPTATLKLVARVPNANIDNRGHPKVKEALDKLMGQMTYSQAEYDEVLGKAFPPHVVDEAAILKELELVTQYQQGRRKYVEGGFLDNPPTLGSLNISNTFLIAKLCSNPIRTDGNFLYWDSIRDKPQFLNDKMLLAQGFDFGFQNPVRYCIKGNKICVDVIQGDRVVRVTGDKDAHGNYDINKFLDIARMSLIGPSIQLTGYTVDIDVIPFTPESVKQLIAFPGSQQGDIETALSALQTDNPNAWQAFTRILQGRCFVEDLQIFTDYQKSIESTPATRAIFGYIGMSNPNIDHRGCVHLKNQLDRLMGHMTYTQDQYDRLLLSQYNIPLNNDISNWDWNQHPPKNLDGIMGDLRLAHQINSSEKMFLLDESYRDDQHTNNCTTLQQKWTYCNNTLLESVLGLNINSDDIFLITDFTRFDIDPPFHGAWVCYSHQGFSNVDNSSTMYRIRPGNPSFVDIVQNGQRVSLQYPQDTHVSLNNPMKYALEFMKDPHIDLPQGFSAAFHEPQPFNPQTVETYIARKISQPVVAQFFTNLQTNDKQVWQALEHLFTSYPSGQDWNVLQTYLQSHQSETSNPLVNYLRTFHFTRDVQDTSLNFSNASLNNNNNNNNNSADPRYGSGPNLNNSLNNSFYFNDEDQSQTGTFNFN